MCQGSRESRHGWKQITKAAGSVITANKTDTNVTDTSTPNNNAIDANVKSTAASTVEARCAKAAGGAKVKKANASNNHVDAGAKYAEAI